MLIIVYSQSVHLNSKMQIVYSFLSFISSYLYQYFRAHFLFFSFYFSYVFFLEASIYFVSADSYLFIKSLNQIFRFVLCSLAIIFYYFLHYCLLFDCVCLFSLLEFKFYYLIQLYLFIIPYYYLLNLHHYFNLFYFR